MSRKTLAVAAFALMAPIAMAQAQIVPKIGIGAGATLPNGDMADDVESGYHALIALKIKPPLSPVGFRVDGMFNQFNDKTSSSSKLRVMGLNANAILSMPGVPLVLSPYVIGGVGMYRTSISPAITGVDPETNLGVNVGAGISFGLAGFGAFAEVRLHNVFPEKPATGTAPNFRFIPITFGISM
jgi:hypothetical protein